MISSPEVGRPPSKDSRHARCGGDPRRTLLQCSQSLPKSSDGRIGIAGIDVTFDFASKLCGGIRGRIKKESGRGKDRLSMLTFWGRLVTDRIARVRGLASSSHFPMSFAMIQLSLCRPTTAPSLAPMNELRPLAPSARAASIDCRY